jgi:hypothetical protein
MGERNPGLFPEYPGQVINVKNPMVALAHDSWM